MDNTDFLANFPVGNLPLEMIIVNDELESRVSLSPDYEKESRSLRQLSKLLSLSPKLALQGLVDEAMKLCGADAAGVSIAEMENGNRIFRWHAVTGTMEPFLNGIMPRDFSPCGVVCERKGPVLMREIIRHYQYVEVLGLHLHEVLLVPFFQEEKPIGTVWVISHGPHKEFTKEDKRLLESLAQFTSGIVESYFRVQTMENMLEELEAEKEVRERFVAALTHDLRTPLTAAKVNLQLMERKSGDVQAVKTLSSRISESLSRVGRMIDDLLDATKLSAGDGIPLHAHECCLDELLKNTTAELNTMYNSRFEFVNEAGNVEVFLDSGSIRRLVENLSGNAVKYGQTHSSIRLILQAENDEVIISVHNWGNPIPLADQGILFKPYRRTATAVKGGQKGWGIGLALVRGIAEAHHGSVYLESTQEKGTIFSVRLPKDFRTRLH